MRDRRCRWDVIGPGTVVIGPGTGQWQCRGLFEDLLAYQGDDWAGDVIDCWAQQHPGVIAELHARDGTAHAAAVPADEPQVIVPIAYDRAVWPLIYVHGVM